MREVANHSGTSAAFKIQHFERTSECLHTLLEKTCGKPVVKPEEFCQKPLGSVNPKKD
jgi:hypothetical protein